MRFLKYFVVYSSASLLFCSSESICDSKSNAMILVDFAFALAGTFMTLSAFRIVAKSTPQSNTNIFTPLNLSAN